MRSSGNQGADLHAGEREPMKALAIQRYKARMEMIELPRPEPGRDDLLVRVRAASVNPVDYEIRDGAVKVLIP
jgi:alcohol dehydrogenase